MSQKGRSGGEGLRQRGPPKGLYCSIMSLYHSRVSLLWLQDDPPQLPEFQFDLNPDLAFYTDADLDPSVHFDAYHLYESVIF